MSQTIPEELTRLHHIYADETCQTKHRWMVIGTTAVSDEHVAHVRAKLLAWKHHMRLQGEIKWSATEASNIERYKTLVRIYFALMKRGIIQFHAILICMDVVDYSKFGDDVPDASYSRFFHYLLLRVRPGRSSSG